MDSQSFLSNKHAHIVFKNYKSWSFQVRGGVPQTSVFCPVLFSLFINGSPTSLLSSVCCSLYTEDLVIWFSFPSVSAADATQEVLIRLERWPESWCLPFNPNKYEASFFSLDLHQDNSSSMFSDLTLPSSLITCLLFLGSLSIALFLF